MMITMATALMMLTVGENAAESPVCLERGAYVPVAQLLKAAQILRLTRVRLGHTHAEDALGKIAVHHAAVLSRHTPGAAGLTLEVESHGNETGQDDEGQERQLPVHVEHHKEDAHQDEEVRGGVHNAFRHKPVDVPHVAGDAGDDASRAIAVVEPQRKALKVLEKALPQRKEQLLAQPA